MLGFREHNRRLRDGPRRNYNVPLSDGRPDALMPFRGQRSIPRNLPRGIQCRTCEMPIIYCSSPVAHGNVGYNPRWRRRYGSPRPDGLPIGRDHRQGHYIDDRPYTSPFRNQGRRRLPQYVDDDYSDDDYSNEDDDDYEYDDPDDDRARLRNLMEMDQGGRRMSFHRERGRPQYPDHSFNYNERPSGHDSRRYDHFDGDMYGRSGRSRGHNMMYVQGEPETLLSY